MNLVPVPVEVPKELWDLLRRVAGPAADEIGLTLRDSLRLVRAELQLRFLQRFQRKLAEANIDPQAVKFSLLFDIISGASVEDDDELQDIWANLLANAADPRRQALVTTAFPMILKQLTKEEVHFLNMLFETGTNPYQMGLPTTDLRPALFDNLRRQRLILTETDKTIPTAAMLDTHALRITMGASPVEPCFLSDLGHEFVAACRSPKQQSQAASQ